MWVIQKVCYVIELSRAEIIIQTNHTTLFNILNQLLIIFITSKIQINIRLIRRNQFLQQF